VPDYPPRPETFLLGDYLESVLFGAFVPPARIAARLKVLQARYGVFAVLGNHDWWKNGRGFYAEFPKAGVRILENQAFPIRLPEGRFWIAGLADELTRVPDPGAAMAGIPRDEPIVAIMHSPRTFLRVPPRVAVSFAGHTHGGQVSLPLIGPMIMPDRVPLRFARGLIEESGKTMFVTSGIGTSIIPVRFLVPPEIVLVTVRSAR